MSENKKQYIVDFLNEEIEKFNQELSREIADIVSKWFKRMETKKECLEILIKLVEKYGDKQITICIEEMSELTKALCKYLRNCDFYLEKMIAIDDIYEEMADVYIMLNQMQLLLKIDNEILDDMIDKKIQRTKERLLDN